MKIAPVLLLTVVTSWAAKLDAEYDWEAWKHKHSKLYYDDREEALRREIWEKNRQFVYQHNSEAMKKMHTFTVEMNKFADLEGEEFAKYFLGARMSRSNSYCLTNSSIMVLDKTYGNLAAEVDWRTKGIVTPVKNQGQCGSCWAFSTTGSLEAQHALVTGNLVSLSEQNLMDCSKAYGDMSCNGGLMDYAFQYIIANGGIDTEASYPYAAQDSDTCSFSKSNIGATMSSCVDVMPRQDEGALQQAVAHVGPVSIAIDASQTSFQLYSSGVYNEPMCSSTTLDHGVLIVGYGTLNGIDYWIVKNSWGPDWGLDGYILMSRNNNNQCGVATQASYPVV